MAGVFHVDLDLFRGPLHTLLTLIEKHELSIARISLVEVADQYLALVRGSGALDLDTAAEFLHVASRLLLLKSQALLPRPPRDEDASGDGTIDEDDLELRLLTYRRYRDAAGVLAARQDAGLRLFGRTRAMVGATPLSVVAMSAAEVPVGTAAPQDERRLSPVRLPIAIDPRRLLRAARRAYTRVAARDDAAAGAPSALISFALVLSRVVETLRDRRSAQWREVVGETDDAITAITMFLVVLELVRRQRLTLRQDEPFGPIELTPTTTLALGTE